MSFDDQSMSVPSLPRSVKVRSTCNACQQAKIRCSHEKPSCRRCQKQHIECVYSMSRRLGRPAKKKDYAAERNVKEAEHHRRERKCRTSRKKARADAEHHNSPDHTAKRSVETPAGEGDQTSVEECLRTPTLPSGLEDPGDYSVPEGLDFTPDSWLQDFVSGQMADDCNLFDGLDCSVPKDPTSSVCLGTGTTSHGCERPGSSYFDVDSTLTTQPGLAMDAPPPANIGSVQTSDTNASSLYSEYEDWKKSLFPPMTDPLPDGLFPPAISTDRTCYDQDYNILPWESLPLDPTPFPSAPAPSPLETSAVPPCQCHELAIRELLRINNCASSCNGPYAIDAILTSQKGLRQLAHTAIQCGVCIKSRENLLMTIVVNIDSLMTILEGVIQARSHHGSGLFETDMGNNVGDACTNINIGNIATCREASSNYIGGITNPFPGQIGTCPLRVGNYRAALDEKNSFVKQVLHARLSGLLATIRKIRQCMQQNLGTSSGRGRLNMIMETDRRVQLMMMKVKMLS